MSIGSCHEAGLHQCLMAYAFGTGRINLHFHIVVYAGQMQADHLVAKVFSFSSEFRPRADLMERPGPETIMPFEQRHNQSHEPATLTVAKGIPTPANEDSQGDLEVPYE